jgi:hypothetical protein
VGPVNKVVERRQIRRAAEEALTDPRLRLPLIGAEFDEPGQQSDDLPPGFGGVPRSNGFASHPASAPVFTTLTFRVRPDPWYRTNAAKLVLVVLGLAAAVASLVVLLWPSSKPEPQPQDAGSTSAPAPTPSASPTPSAPPSAELLPPSPAPPVGLPPGVPPPPPPPSADQMAPPAAPPRYYPPPQYDEPTQKKPDTGLTRAPISVAPQVKAPTGPSGSAIPGDAPPRKHRGFF